MKKRWGHDALNWILACDIINILFRIFAYPYPSFVLSSVSAAHIYSCNCNFRNKSLALVMTTSGFSPGAV